MIQKAVNRPVELYEVFRKQSVETADYEIFTQEMEKNVREVERIERTEENINLDYYEGKITEEVRDKLVGINSQKRQSLEARNAELEQKMSAIIKLEEARFAFESFESDFHTNLDNLSFEQKRLLVDMLVESIEVTVVSSQPHINIKLRFDQSKMGQNGAVVEPQKTAPEPTSGSGTVDIFENGATDRARTYDLSLRRAAL
jgi:hypothetical protein